MKRSSLQEEFARGTRPKNLDGFYRGNLELLIPQTITQHVANLIAQFWLPWKGKVFYAKTNSGDNIVPSYLELFARNITKASEFKKEFGGIHVFPFKTLVTMGKKDPQQVLQLNYDLAENPPKVRTVVDELVTGENNTFLGKAYLKENDQYRLVAYFRLRSDLTI